MQMKKIISTMLLLTSIVMVSPSTVNAESQKENLNSNTFEEVLNDYNISIDGENGYVSKGSLQSLINEIEDESVSGYYEMKLNTRSNEIEITPEEVVEMDFYSRSSEEQLIFLNEVRNQKIDVQIEGEVMLISYNPNIPVTRGSSLITSSRTGIIKMQDPVMGDWGSAEITLKAVFKKSQSGNQYGLSVTSYDVKESNKIPVQIIGTTVYKPAYTITFTGSYKGNEASCHSLTQVSCSGNGSQLQIYVYPNSTYNYAKVG